MIRWLINKLTAEEIRKIEIDMQKLILRQEALEENQKRTRAYVGYHGKKASRSEKKATNKQDLAFLDNPETQAWFNALQPDEQQEIYSRLSSRNDGDSPDSEDSSDEGFAEDSEQDRT